MNLVLDDVEELMRGKLPPSSILPYLLMSCCSLGHARRLEWFANIMRWQSLDDEGNERTRSLGLIVARGTLLVLISPMDGSMPIANPFLQQGEGGGVGMSVCDSGYLARAASCFIDIAKGTHYSKASNSWKDGLDVLAEHDTERSDQSYHHWDCAWPGAGFMKRNIWWNTCGSSHSTTNGSMALVVTGNGVLLLIEREPRWRRI